MTPPRITLRAPGGRRILRTWRLAIDSTQADALDCVCAAHVRALELSRHGIRCSLWIDFRPITWY